jgi:hypothetical protein
VSVKLYCFYYPINKKGRNMLSLCIDVFALPQGFGMGALLLILFSTYGLAMRYGSKLVIEKGYTGGTVMSVIISLMTSGV